MKATKFSVMAVIALGSFMALAPTTRAQDKKDDEVKPKAQQRERAARPQNATKRIAEELNLTDVQKPKFEALMKERREKGQELSKNTDLSAEEKRTKRRELHQDTTAKMKKILDADQFEKWGKLQQAGTRARVERPAGDKPAGDKSTTDK